MAFLDMDPIEENIGVACSKMKPAQLISYITAYQNAFGRKLALDGMPELSVFKAMKRIYGDEDAGLIVKWVFYKYHGEWNGEIVSFMSFTKGRRWWVDKMYQEMQEFQRKEIRSAEERVPVGAGSLLDVAESLRLAGK